MEFIKEFFLIMLEMAFAIFIIIFGYAIWDNFDLTNYNTAKYYDDAKDIEMYLEDDKNYISSLNNEDNSEYAKLYLHNISNENNTKKLFFKISKDNIYMKENAVLNINNNYFELNNLEYIEEDYFYNFIIDDINLDSYETKKLYIKILLKEEVIKENINYEFTTII